MNPVSLTIDFATVAALLLTGEAWAGRRRAKRALDACGRGSGAGDHGLMDVESFVFSLSEEVNRAARFDSAVRLHIGRVSRGDVDACARELAGHSVFPCRGFVLGGPLLAYIEPVRADGAAPASPDIVVGDVAWVAAEFPADADHADALVRACLDRLAGEGAAPADATAAAEAVRDVA